MSRWLVAASGIVVAGCGVGAPGPDAGAPPAFTIDVPPIDVPPASERVVCFYTTLTTGGAILRWASEQSPGGHGLQVFATPSALHPDGTVVAPCVYQDAAGTALPRMLYTANLLADSADLPPGYAMPVVAPQPIVIRLHLLNASDAPELVGATIRGYAVEPGADFVPVATYVSYRTDLDLAPHADATVSGACPVPPGLALLRLTTLTLDHATGTEIDDDSGRLFRGSGSSHVAENDWIERPHPIVGPLRYTCAYRNPTDQPIVTGGVEGRDELCMVLAQVAPARRRWRASTTSSSTAGERGRVRQIAVADQLTKSGGALAQ